MATASQGTMSGVEEAEPEPLTFTLYPINTATSEVLTERVGGLLPEFGEKPIPFSALKPAGKGNIFLFTVARATPGSVFGKDYSLESGDPDKVVLLGLAVLYAGGGGYINAKLVVLATRTSLLPPAEEGFVPNRYITFALPKLATFLRQTFPGRSILLRVPRKQKLDDPEYLGTLGTLATLGFAYSHYNAMRTRVKFKLLDVPEAVDYGQVEVSEDTVVYKYANPGKITYDQPFTFPNVEAVQMELPGKMELSPSVEMVADALVVMALPNGKDITIPDVVLADPDPMEPRRGGKRKTYRKKARKGKTARRRA